ncbi:hypothetical protein M9Y10_004555 [Tritrichomonas musculus]|uniref:DNA-damage-inducible protein J n=1 Tax=Tritrichomonas musculus TaxID=1915356 RepID=A0ABR2GNL3_9EUKA
MASVSVTVRIDEDLKKDFENTLDDIGLTTTAAFTVFAKAVAKQHRIPFELVADPFWSEKNQKHLRSAIKNLENGKGKEHELIEVNDD